MSWERKPDKICFWSKTIWRLNGLKLLTQWWCQISFQLQSNTVFCLCPVCLLSVWGTFRFLPWTSGHRCYQIWWNNQSDHHIPAVTESIVPSDVNWTKKKSLAVPPSHIKGHLLSFSFWNLRITLHTSQTPSASPPDTSPNHAWPPVEMLGS